MKSNIRNEIKAQIIRAGYTMQEVVDQLHDEYGWSDSVSNLPGNCSGNPCGIGRPWNWPTCWDMTLSGRNGGMSMEKAQYAIMRFVKYKGPEIGNIEAHNERTKESTPAIRCGHQPKQVQLPSGHTVRQVPGGIRAADCRCRMPYPKRQYPYDRDAVHCQPEFFKGKKRAEIRVFFEEALNFLEQHQSKETIISAVVHMDEKTPHMHLCFVPLTEDGRLSAKDIMGNKKKLTWWQDEFWKHMVKKFPDLERGESASLTGRDHIPPACSRR